MPGNSKEKGGNMGSEQNRPLMWMTAAAISVGLHVLVIAALVGVGGGERPEPVAAKAEEPSGGVNGRGARSPSVPDGGTENTGSVVSAGGAASTGGADASSAQKEEENLYYVVKAGDNLSKIAKHHGTTINELAELNGKPVNELSRLQIGQKIKVRGDIE